MKHILTLALVALFIIPTLATAQESMLDSSFEDDLDFDTMFEQMDEDVRQENVATSSFNEKSQKSTPKPTKAPVRASQEEDVYSTDETEIILYRQNKEVKRLPFNTPIDQVQTQPDTGETLVVEEEEPDLEIDDLDDLELDSDFSSGGLIQEADFEDTAVGSGTVAETQTGSTAGSLKKSASSGSIISSGTLTMGVSIIAIVVGGFFGLTIMKKRKLDAGLPDMPSGLGDASKINKLEAALEEIKG